jgi:hypothetical protein
MNFLSRFNRSKKGESATVPPNGVAGVPPTEALPTDNTQETSTVSSEKPASVREDGRIDELEKQEVPGDSLNRLNSRGEDPSMYPSGLKMNLITLSLCMAVFLIALVCLSSRRGQPPRLGPLEPSLLQRGDRGIRTHRIVLSHIANHGCLCPGSNHYW